MTKIYLEYFEEHMCYITEGTKPEDLKIEELDSETQFTPMFVHRAPIEGVDTLELEVPFDVDKATLLHFVIINYSMISETGSNEEGKWFIEGIYPTRRLACEKVLKLQKENDYSKFSFYSPRIYNVINNIHSLLVE